MSLFRKIPCWMSGKNNKQSVSHMNNSKIYSKISLLNKKRAWRRRAALKPNRKEAPSCTSVSASYTVEASVILPFFLAAVLFVLFFFRIMSVQWGVQRALEDTCRLLAVTAKTKSGETESEEMGSGGMESDGIYGAMVYYLLRLREYEVPFSYIQGGMLGMDCSEFSQ